MAIVFRKTLVFKLLPTTLLLRQSAPSKMKDRRTRGPFAAVHAVLYIHTSISRRKSFLFLHLSPAAPLRIILLSWVQTHHGPVLPTCKYDAYSYPRVTYLPCYTSSFCSPQQVPPPVKSRKRARQIVTSFHKLTREADEVASGKAADKQAQLQRLDRELKEMGGRQAYQSASLLSVRFHNTSKWVTQRLTGMGLRPAKGEPPLRVLEVMKHYFIMHMRSVIRPCLLQYDAWYLEWNVRKLAGAMELSRAAEVPSWMIVAPSPEG